MKFDLRFSQPCSSCHQVKGDDSSLWMPVGDIPDDLTASEYYPQEELIIGSVGTASDQSDKIKEFISRCEHWNIHMRFSYVHNSVR